MIEIDAANGLDWYQTPGAPIAIVERQYLPLWTGNGVTDDSLEWREAPARGGRTELGLLPAEPLTPPDYDKIMAISGDINKIEFGGGSLIAITNDLIAARFFPSHQVLVSIHIFGVSAEVYDNILASPDTAEWEDNFEFVITEGDMVMFESVEAGTEVQDQDTCAFRLNPGRYHVQSAYFVIGDGIEGQGFCAVVSRFREEQVARNK